jgi:hypothetical protein
MSTRSNDWVENNREAFHTQVNRTGMYLNPTEERAKLTDFGYPPGSKIAVMITNDFLLPVSRYNTTYAAWLNLETRTKAVELALDAAEKEVREAYRMVHGLFKGNPLVLDEDLVMMGMPRRHVGGGSPVPPPKTVPTLEIERPSTGVVVVHFHDKEAENKAKPYGVHGIEFLYGILDHPPVSLDELTRSAFDTRTPYKFTFGIEEVGKNLYIAARWENTRGEKGDWTDVYHTLIA